MHKCGYAAEKGKAKQEKGKEKRGPAENQGGLGVGAGSAVLALSVQRQPYLPANLKKNIYMWA